MRITLNESEQRIARWLAKQRYANNRKNNVEDRKVGPQSNEFTDLNGIGAELAFCKMLNIYPDLSVCPRSGGHDCISPKGYKIDVKSTKYENGRLLAMLGKEDAEVYVLVVGEFPTYRWVGWARADELICEENIIDLGHGDTYALPQERLNKTGEPE